MCDTLDITGPESIPKPWRADVIPNSEIFRKSSGAYTVYYAIFSTGPEITPNNQAHWDVHSELYAYSC